MKQSEADKKQEELFRRDWKKHVDSFAMTGEQKQRMWSAIQQKRGKKTAGRAAGRALGAAAAIVCMILIGAGGVNETSGGKVAESIREAGGDDILKSIRRLCGMEPESAQIIQNMTPEMEVYAPPLLDCDENRVIFTNSRGMVIYDRQQQTVAATVDLQEIGCNYFTVDSLRTRIIIEGGRLRIFNEKEGQVMGNCYVYRLPEHTEGVENLKPEKVIKAEPSLQDVWEQKMKSRYYKTFDSMGNEVANAWTEKEPEIKYSEYSVLWMREGKQCMSCLLLQDGDYQLYTRVQEAGEAMAEPLQISVSEESAGQVKDANALPEFVYTGEDAILKAVCEYLVQEERDRYDETGERISYVFIPAPVIYDIIEEGGEYKVFGNFYGSNYYKNGNILEESGGGEMPACIHLKKENGQYQVAGMEKSGDGAYYATGIREFCQGHEDICEKYFDHESTDKVRRQMEMSMIEQYVTDNQLDIRYYHQYGWDPVELFTED